MEKKITKTLFITESVFLAVIIGGSALAYWLFTPFYYSYQRSKMIKTAFADLKEMDFGELDESDGSVLSQYESENLLFTIADEDFTPLYTSWTSPSGPSERQVYKHIILCKDKFSEDPQVIDRETKNPEAVKLLGLIQQDGHLYYVNIREKIYAVRTTISYMGLFLLQICLFFVAVGLPIQYLIFRNTAKKIGGDTEETAREDRGLDLKSKDQQELLDHIRRDVVADISHELKTPLAIISSQVEMLHCMGEQVDKEYYYDSILEEIDRMSDMVNNLMDLSLMEYHIQKMEQKVMDLSDTMEYIRVRYQGLFKQRHIKEQFSLEEDCKIRGNAYYLEQAIDNFMMNALSHTGQGKAIKVCLYREDGWVWVSVYNEGEKIEDTLMEKIWQGYVVDRPKQGEGREEDALQQRHMGIGLYLVRRIIQLHQGEYGVENLEKGVRFWFKIPEVR